MQPPQGGYPPGPPPGYHGSPHHQQPQYAPPAPVPQNPSGRVEVKLSYGARVGCAVAIGVAFMIVAVVAVVAYYLNPPGPKAVSSSSLPSCGSALSGEPTCTDHAAAGGHSYQWTISEAGTYTVVANDTGPSGPAQCLRIERDSNSLAFECGTPGAVSVTLALTPGVHRIGVTDLVPSVSAKHPYTLAVTKKDGSSDSRPFPAAVLIFVVLGLIFFGIPMILSSEKKRIPRYIDRTGVTMRNGTHFPWQEYRGVKVLMERRGSTTSEVGVEIMFSRGTAIIRYRPITNPGEVLYITEQLKQGRDPFYAG